MTRFQMLEDMGFTVYDFVVDDDGTCYLRLSDEDVDLEPFYFGGMTNEEGEVYGG